MPAPITTELVVGDTATPLGATIYKNGQPYDLSDFDSVEFQLIQDSDDSQKVAWAAAAFVDAAAGRVQYQWTSGDVDTAGVFWAAFRVKTAGGATETFPPQGHGGKARTWKIIFNPAT